MESSPALPSYPIHSPSPSPSPSTCPPIRFKFLVCLVPGLRTAIHFFVLRRFAVGVGKFYLLGSSGGQSGWLEGWAARNAGLLSSSRSMRRIMGYGRKSTWNLERNRNQWIKLGFSISRFSWFRIILTFGHWTPEVRGSSPPWRSHRPRNICRPKWTAPSQPPGSLV